MISNNSDNDRQQKHYENKSKLMSEGRLKTVADSQELGDLWNPLNWDFREFICGWGSAFVNICLTYPINKVAFRQVSVK